VVTEVIAAQPLKYWGLEISLKISINSKQTHISDVSSGPGRLVLSGLIPGEQVKHLGLEFSSKLI